MLVGFTNKRTHPRTIFQAGFLDNKNRQCKTPTYIHTYVYENVSTMCFLLRHRFLVLRTPRVLEKTGLRYLFEATDTYALTIDFVLFNFLPQNPSRQVWCDTSIERVVYIVPSECRTSSALVVIFEFCFLVFLFCFVLFCFVCLFFCDSFTLRFFVCELFTYHTNHGVHNLASMIHTQGRF